MPCRVWTDGEGELERQNAVSKYKTSLWKASANPGNRLGILTVDGACGTPPPENGLGPTGEQAADEDELADVVGVVVGEQESLAEERLVIGVSDGREEIG